ncbi:MAG: ribosomal protein S18-alanine N-acetyltransferase [Steroidobacteraceae bacterium]|nr:ribosomal protein S18-alanine N-acetyltransferase [Steroidobacteraceae bacterium]MDW8259772.1 ribosomal protein S18-alanine N-acetyltransferase [Gammaproteobacteria bacterium]
MATAPDDQRTLAEVALRAMREEDVPRVYANERRAYAFPWSEGIFRDCVRVGYVCRVLELNGALIGHGILSIGAGEAHLLNLCIVEEFRCRGLGRLLMEHLLQAARAAGARSVYLEVRPSNTTAIRLYQSLGFEHVGTRRGYYQAADGREDACVLRVQLN